MPLEIATVIRVRALAGYAPVLTRTARRVATAEGFSSGYLSIAVVNRRTIAKLHERHLGDPATTDVLTFDLGSDRRRRWLDAEVVVCADVARRAAARRQRYAPPLPTAAFKALAAGVAQPAGRPRGTRLYRDARQCAAETVVLTAAELALYVVHGLLHLSGYDDHDPSAARIMHAREDALLVALGLGPVYTAGS